MLNEELLSTARAWKENAKIFEDLGKVQDDKRLAYGYRSIASTFTSNAKILEAYGKSVNPNSDKYRQIFPEEV